MFFVVFNLEAVFLFPWAGPARELGWAAGTAVSAWLLIVVLVITSVAGLFYYLRVLVTLYSAPAEHPAPIPIMAPGSAFILGTLTILLIWFGVYPTPLLNLIRATMGGLN
ncbi:MAG: NADH-quinone oxidoreductase subunit A [Bryobacteraceae bacterium]|jgi:NADH-quinone oxidoreductase subunit N